mmetsp:Transcript_80975/g.203797  ORF Transcript_80975/g.203797 Transcript_80975/m.203797 type:complete len:218 (-) Transcript_80975:501-1154(-)
MEVPVTSAPVEVCPRAEAVLSALHHSRAEGLADDGLHFFAWDVTGVAGHRDRLQLCGRELLNLVWYFWPLRGPRIIMTRPWREAQAIREAEHLVTLVVCLDVDEAMDMLCGAGQATHVPRDDVGRILVRAPWRVSWWFGWHIAFRSSRGLQALRHGHLIPDVPQRATDNRGLRADPCDVARVARNLCAWTTIQQLPGGRSEHAGDGVLREAVIAFES